MSPTSTEPLVAFKRINATTSDLGNDTMLLESPSTTIVTTMFITGVVGNLLAIYVLVRSAKLHKWRAFNRLVFALAMFDLFGTIATSPVTLLVYSNNFVWVGGQPTCDYFSFMLIFAGLTTVFTVGMMALDRYLAVCYPYFYKAHLTIYRIKYVVLSIIVVAFIIACLPIVGIGRNVQHFPGSWCFFDFYGYSVQQHVFSFTYASIGISVITMTATLNVIVIVVLGKERRRKDEQNRKSSIHSASSRTRKRNDIYFMFFLIAILLVFGVCWTPLMIRIIMNQAHYQPLCVKCDLLAVRLASFNQILDPWVYILLRKENIIRFGRCIAKRRAYIQRGLSSIRSYGSEKINSFRKGSNKSNDSHNTHETYNLSDGSVNCETEEIRSDEIEV